MPLYFDLMNYQKIIKKIHQEVNDSLDKGVVASYIPALKKVDANKFGVSLCTIKNDCFGVGDFEEKFSIQSISKVFGLTLALKLIGINLWNRVDVEPSGDPFNSLVQLEFEKGIPRNPLINSGALVVCDVLISKLENPKKGLLQFVQKLANNKNIHYNLEVMQSETEHGFKNAAHVNLMKSFGNIENDIDEVLDLYYHMCSIEMTCSELANAFLIFANSGKLIHNNEQVITRSISKRINATILTCGLYDEAGEFAFKVGLPGKSGVGGGIVAIHPGEYAIAVWSPKLNTKKNSFKGMNVLEKFTTETTSSIF